MNKTLQIQPMKNGLVLHIRVDGKPEGIIVADDGSAAYKQFREAFDTCDEDGAKPSRDDDAEPEDDRRARAGGRAARDHGEDEDEDTSDLEAHIGALLGQGLNWLNQAESRRHKNRSK